MEAGDLHWTQPDPFARAYQLGAGGEILATLRWQKPWGSLARATTAAGVWTLKRDGFWHPRILVRAAGSDAEAATFRAGFGGAGILEMADGRLFFWGSTNFWQVEWIWQDAVKRPLVRFRSKHGLRTAEATVTIEPAGRGHPDLPLLVTLGWYLLMLLALDAASAAGSF
jgi:hypothetical protein